MQLPTRAPASTRTAVVVLASVCLAARLLLFLAVRPWDEAVEKTIILRSDAAGYHQLATNLVEHHQFAQQPDGEPETLRTPLYPLFVAGVYRAFGAAPWIVLLLQTLLDALTCLLLFFAIRNIAGGSAAWFAALFHALDPFLVFYCVALMSETLFVLFCVIALYLLSIALERRFAAGCLPRVAGAALALGLAALVRPIATYLFAPILFFFVWTLRADPRKAWKASATFAAVFLVTLSPWLARNFANAGSVSLSTSGAYNLLVLNVGPMEMERTGQPMSVVREALLDEAARLMLADGVATTGANGFVEARYQARLAKQRILERPLSFLKFYALGIFTSFSNLETRGYADVLGLRGVDEDRFDLRAHPNPLEMIRAALAHKSAGELVLGGLSASFLLISYTCLVAGLWAARALPSGAARSFYLLCGILAAYFILLTGAAGLARFKVAATPFLEALAGAGAAWLWPKLLEKFGRARSSDLA